MAYDFGMRLKLCREKKGLSQKAAGKKLGISGSAISAFENNISTPSVERLKQFAVLYNVSVDFLLNLVPPAIQEQEDQKQEQIELLQQIQQRLIDLEKDLQDLKASINK